MASAIPLLIEFGQSPWYDNLTRALADGGLQKLIDTHGIRGVTSNPTIFEKAMACRHRLRRATAARSPRPAGRPSTAYWDLVTTDIEHAADVLRPIYDRSTAPTASYRSRSPPISRTTPPGTVRPGEGAVGAHRPPERDDQDPGHARGHARDHPDAGRGNQRQRHPDLQPRALPAGDRRVPRRTRTARRRRRRHLTPRVGRVVLREPGRHRDRSPAPRRTRAAGQGRGRQRQARVPAVPRRSSSGARWENLVAPSARACSGRCGRRRRRRTRPTPPRSTSTSSSAPTRSTRWRRLRSTCSPRATTTCAPTRSPKTSTVPRQVIADLAGRGCRLRRRHRHPRARRRRVVREVVPRRARHAREEGRGASSSRVGRRTGRRRRAQVLGEVGGLGVRVQAARVGHHVGRHAGERLPVANRAPRCLSTASR